MVSSTDITVLSGLLKVCAYQFLPVSILLKCVCVDGHRSRLQIETCQHHLMAPHPIIQKKFTESLHRSFQKSVVMGNYCPLRSPDLLHLGSFESTYVSRLQTRLFAWVWVAVVIQVLNCLSLGRFLWIYREHDHFSLSIPLFNLCKKTMSQSTLSQHIWLVTN
jgi:hypothetical protein